MEQWQIGYEHIAELGGLGGCGETTNIQFGGCDGKIANGLPIMKGWNYTVRLYRARPGILNGKWKFPEAQPAN